MPNNTLDHQAVDEETIARSQRSGRIAVTVFPLLILAGGVIAFLTPSTFASWSDYVPYGLMLIMFGMGLTLRIPDFALVLKRPLVVLMGVLAQFTIMPLTALLIARVLDLPDQLAAGLILLGCVPGGTASNVVAYLAKGDVALSVTMTSISTLLSPIVTPILTLWLAGQYLPVEAGSMAISIVQIVVVPITAGLILRALIPLGFDAHDHVRGHRSGRCFLGDAGHRRAADVLRSHAAQRRWVDHRARGGVGVPLFGTRTTHDQHRGRHAEFRAGLRARGPVLHSRGRDRRRHRRCLVQHHRWSDRCGVGTARSGPNPRRPLKLPKSMI